MRLAILGLLALSMLCLAAGPPVWQARERHGMHTTRLDDARVKPLEWPAEPESPSKVTIPRLADALISLCGQMPAGRDQDYARWTISAAQEFDIDPFLLGALMYRHSHCQSTRRQFGGVGLTSLVPEMYRRRFSGKAYRYRVNRLGRWLERRLEIPKFAFNDDNLMHAESHLYLAAGLLRAWRDQEETVHEYFEQAPHRHYVSHWVWGDRVISSRQEDRILCDRRRLLEYYGSRKRAKPVRGRGTLLHSPLDGAPRVVSSGLGSERDGGARRHRGIDLESDFGETVRSVADGTVVFAGVDLPGHRANVMLTTEEINNSPRQNLGAGGRYICISHKSDAPGGLRTCYMHLERVEVHRGQFVLGSQRIGTVGRTGIKTSAPHLHLEFHSETELLNPLLYLHGLVVGTPMRLEGNRVVHQYEIK